MTQASSSACGMWRVEAEDLIPGLPNCVILNWIVPRLAWHTRAVLVATSKAWNVALQEPHIYSELSRRAFDAVPRKRVILLHQLSEAETEDFFRQTRRLFPRPLALSILEDENLMLPDLNMRPTDDTWTRRRLPPIPDFTPLSILHDCGIACVNGKIFVMGGWDPLTGAICARMYMLDIGAGLWRWETMPPMSFPRAFFHCVSSEGKIYAIGGSCVAIHDPNPDPNSEVYNVDTQTWELLPKVVLSRSLHYNGVYFVTGANLLVAHGWFYTIERGEFVRFRRAYNPGMQSWRDYECEDEGNDDVNFLEDFIISKWVDGRRCAASTHGNFTDGNLTFSVARHQVGVIQWMMMK